jgi:hypothetical protein
MLPERMRKGISVATIHQFGLFIQDETFYLEKFDAAIIKLAGHLTKFAGRFAHSADPRLFC